MPKISVVLAHVPAPNLDVRLDKCLKSLKGYDELVLVLNDGIGFGKAFNRGFKYATGDYIIAVSNDTVLEKGNLQELCMPDVVTSPMINNVVRDNEFWACFFCWPRNVYESIGGFDESFGLAYYEDTDLRERFKQADIPMVGVPTVKVYHEGGATVKTISNEDENMKIGEKRFIEKYGYIPE